MEPGESVLRHGSSEEALLPAVQVRNEKNFRLRVTIEPLVLCVFFADTLTASVTTNFILLRTCLNHFHFNESICSELGNQTDLESVIQPYSAFILTGMDFLPILFAAVLALFAGPWSDYNGRKLLLVLPAFGYALKYLTLAILSVIPSLGPEYGFLSILPVSFSGGIVIFISACYSYVSDISGREDRFLRITILEVIFGIGAFLGLVSVSELLIISGKHAYVVVYSLSSGLIVLSAVYTWFFVPESVEMTENGLGILHVFDVELLKEMFRVCFKKREGNKRMVIFLIILSLTLTIGAGAGESNVLFLFTRLRFGWNIQNFTFWSSISFVAFLSGGVLSSVVFTKYVKVSDSFLGVLMYFMKTVYHFLIGFIPPNVPKLMFYSCFFSVFGGICAPISRTILSKIVPKHDLGKVFALTSTGESVFPLILEPVYTALYGYTLDTLPSAFLFLSGGIFIICTIFFLIIYFFERTGNLQSEPTESG